jgi:hypothetical protein
MGAKKSNPMASKGAKRPAQCGAAEILDPGDLDPNLARLIRMASVAGPHEKNRLGFGPVGFCKFNPHRSRRLNVKAYRGK